MDALLPLPEHDLLSLVRTAQRDGRVPAVAAAVARCGDVGWSGGAGAADIAERRLASSADMQYRIGSITKTFTAAAVLLLAENHAIELDAPLDRYVRATPFGASTIRQLLAHLGGVQREAPGDMWATGQGPTADELLRDIGAAERVARPGDRWHYSNLGYALLGLAVVEVTGTAPQRVIEERLLGPLALSRTTWTAVPPAAMGYVRRPWEDSVVVAQDMDQRAVGVGGQLWSTLADLAVWADVLMGGRPDILPAAVVERMHAAQVITDDSWASAWGLGLSLRRDHGRTVAGHTGAMDGFLSGLALHRPSRTAAVVFANATRGIDAGDLAARLLHVAVDAAPRHEPVWQPGDACPAALVPALGPWWCEGEETTFEWRDGRLHAYLSANPTARSVFRQLDDDEFRVEAGRLRGERLSIERTGPKPTALVWAAYRYERAHDG